MSARPRVRQLTMRRLAARYRKVDPSPPQRRWRWVLIGALTCLVGTWGGLGWATRQWSPVEQVQYIRHHTRARVSTHKDKTPVSSPTVNGRLVG